MSPRERKKVVILYINTNSFSPLSILFELYKHLKSEYLGWRKAEATFIRKFSLYNPNQKNVALQASYHTTNKHPLMSTRIKIRI